MKRKWLGKWISMVGLVVAAVCLGSLSSCARSQQLTSISIVPSGFTYGNAVPAGITQTPIPLTAYGTYIHPPATKDITDSVTWASDVTPVANVDSDGNLTAGPSCGGANISATYYTDDGNKNGNLVVAYMFVTVDGPASLGCTPAGTPPTLTVTVTGTVSSGTVTSSPAGITCSIGSSCSAEFTVGTAITLSATPAGSFQTWSGCNVANGPNCTVFLQNSTTVTANFD